LRELSEEEWIRKNLKRLIEIKSISGEERDAISFVIDLCKELGFDKSFIDEVNNGICIKGGESFSVLMAPHIDTVPGYYDVKEIEDKIIGRGAVDAKGPLISMLLASSREYERAGINFVALVDEEGKNTGSKNLINKGNQYDYIIVGEPSNISDYVIEYRGYAFIDMECRANPSHSSFPNSASAYEIFHNIYYTLKKIFIGEKYENPSITLTKICGGEYYNVTPTNVRAILDTRFPYPYSIKDIIKLINDVIKTNDCSYNIISSCEPVKVQPSNSIARSIARAISKAGMKPRPVRKFGSSDMNILVNIAKRGIIAYGPGDSKFAHTNYEEISVKDVFVSSKVIENAINALSNS